MSEHALPDLSELEAIDDVFELLSVLSHAGECCRRVTALRLWPRIVHLIAAKWWEDEGQLNAVADFAADLAGTGRKDVLVGVRRETRRAMAEAETEELERAAKLPGPGAGEN